MGRKKFFDEDTIKTIYNRCYSELNAIRGEEDGGYLLSPQLVELTGYKQSQISKALQWGRRQFAEGNLQIDQWIMASPKGYFLPKRGGDDRVFAYAVQNIKDIRSRTRTQLPLYEALLMSFPEQLRLAFMKSTHGREEISTEMNPWSVFNTIMENEYIRPVDQNDDGVDYRDEEWEEYL